MQLRITDYDEARCDRYRALSLFQPWAKYLCEATMRTPTGEREAWFPIFFLPKYTDYRGELLICSAGPEGQTIGLVEVYDCIPATQLAPDEWERACAMKSERKKMEKRFAVFTRNARRVVEFPAQGAVDRLWWYICPKGEVTEYPRRVVLGDNYERLVKKK